MNRNHHPTTRGGQLTKARIDIPRLDPVIGPGLSGNPARCDRLKSFVAEYAARRHKS